MTVNGVSRDGPAERPGTPEPILLGQASRPLQSRTIGPAMLYHAALITIICVLTAVGFLCVIALTGPRKRKYGRHRKSEREPGDTPLTA